MISNPLYRNILDNKIYNHHHYVAPNGDWMMMLFVFLP